MNKNALVTVGKAVGKEFVDLAHCANTGCRTGMHVAGYVYGFCFGLWAVGKVVNLFEVLKEEDLEEEESPE